MLSPDLHPSVSLRAYALHAIVLPVPIVCFIATLITDVVYWRSKAIMWADMSDWLLTVGVLVAAAAAVAGLVEYFGDWRIRELRAARVHLAGNTLALVISAANALVHTRDAYTSVVPAGLTLSSLVVLILAVTAWNGWSIAHRREMSVHQVQP